MKILMVSSEAVPFSKSGGLADVVGALPPALNKLGHDSRIIIPAYNTKDEDCGEELISFDIEMLARTEKIRITRKIHNNVIYYFVCHHCFNKRLGIYGDTSFEPYADNLERFTILCKAALSLCESGIFSPDIIHCHDWTTGFLPYFLKESNKVCFKNIKTVFTIHNLAYQGTFPRLSFLQTAVTPSSKLFKDNQVNMLKSGLIFSDYITTVSPTYAKEIQTPAQGCGLDDILNERTNNLKGIINGIDINEWNPETDQFITEHFSAANPQNKAAVKSQMQKLFKLKQDPNVPVFAMISRLAGQKGFDALVPCLDQLLSENNLQFLIIGTGDHKLENRLLEIASRHDNISVNIMFSNSAAHIVEAGSDFFLMPSRYEPCGLNQLYSLRYGTLPIARRTGGLADSIIDLDENPTMGTGFLFNDLTSEEISRYVIKATELYKKENYNEYVIRAMQQNFSWESSARKYETMFAALLNNR